MADSCEQVNELSCSIKGGNFLTSKEELWSMELVSYLAGWLIVLQEGHCIEYFFLVPGF
jgi:hypothetical protein